MIRLQHINFVREQRAILHDVNLHMKNGEQWVILGRNGSGKTTLLEMISGYLFPSSGQVEVLGQRYGEVDLREVRKRLGYISQSLFEKLTLRDPVWEVVVTGQFAYLRMYEAIPEAITDKAIGMLEQLNIAHLRDQPLGTLSQGERKKVMLARTLMADPEIIVMDEPCSGLDLFERESMLESIGTLRRNNVQLIYVTHHMEEIIPLFTHVALIEEGRIIAAGEKEQVLTAEHLRRAFKVNVLIEWDHGRPWIKIAQSQESVRRN